MNHRLRLVSLLALAISARAGAQSAAILGKNDAAFARQLLKAGYPDLAEGVCKAIGALEKSGKANPKDVIDVQALQLDLDLEKARVETDLTKRKDLISEVLSKKQDFIKAHADSPQAEETRNNLPDAYGLLGEALTAALKEEKDGPTIFKLRTEGDNSFKQAEEALQARFEKLKAAHDADPPLDLDIPLMAAAYNIPRTYYFHSLLFTGDDAKKKELLGNAIEGFQEFGLDYSDQLLNFEGYIYQGLCNRDLGSTKEAILDFDDAIKLRESYRRSPQGVYELNDDAVAIVATAVLQKILVLTELKEYAKANEAALEYLKTTPDPLGGTEGLKILAAQADAQAASGDTAGANETAQKLVDKDPQGPWGARGRELLGKSLSGSGAAKNLGAEKTLKVAETLASNGEYDRALQICREAIVAADGSDDEANVGVEAYMLMGQIYNKRGWLHEAAAAFDAAPERYPKGERAADALWGSVNIYLDLSRQEKGRSYYTKRSDARMQTLAEKYPTSGYAARAQFIEAKKLEDEQNWLKAAELFQKIQPGSDSYEEGLLRAGSDYLQYATKLLKEKKSDEAGAFLSQAETLLKKALADVERKAGTTLDRDVLARLGNLAFGARTTLASLYLLDGVNREPEVTATFANADEKYAQEPDKLAVVWKLRIRALQQQGKLDEAVGLLEALMHKNPNTKNLGAAAGALARALDQRSMELRAKDAESKPADDYWQKAARYYILSVSGQLKGEETVRASDLTDVANRLYVIGLHFNGVPENLDNFVGWKGDGRKASDMLGEAAKMYEAALTTTPSYATMISLGRTYGFLAKWKEASQVYARLFDQEPLLNKTTGKFNGPTLAAKPQLMSAYLEWGVAEHQTALAEKDKDKERFIRAAGIFETMSKNTETDSKLWWQSKYYQIRNLVDRGEYSTADIGLRSVERTTKDFDQGKYGYKQLFLEMKGELSKKVFPSAPANVKKETAATKDPQDPNKPR